MRISYACKGNGKSLGLTNGTSYGGVIFRDGVYSKTNAYNVSIGAVANNILNPSNGNFAVGVTTDGAKSGIVVDIIRLQGINHKWIIRWKK